MEVSSQRFANALVAAADERSDHARAALETRVGGAPR
jgi:hypothetical protein